MTDVVTSLSQRDGIIAVGYKTNLGHSTWEGPGALSLEAHRKWDQQFEAAFRLMDTYRDQLKVTHDVRIILGNQAWNLRCENGTYLAIVSIHGHPITKSLQRTLRRTLQQVIKYHSK